MASSKGDGLRFYGVIDADGADSELLDKQHVSVVTFRDLAAVVAVAPYVRGHPTDAQLQQYIAAIDALSARTPVIPAPPGAVFRNEAVLSEWLDVHYAKLHEALGVIERRDDGRAPYDFVRMELKA